jgi:formylglycine-generating enzyme required for sulfatase activity
MKSYSLLALAAVSAIFATPVVSRAAPTASPFVYETSRELFGNGDFDGDGQMDAVIIDKETGKFRLGYQQSGGLFNWVDCRPSGIKGVAGASIARIFKPNLDAIAFTSPDANQLSIVDVSSSTAPGRPVSVPFSAGLGPNTVIAVDIGGEGNTPELDFFVGSIYNSPDPSQLTLLRNDGREFPPIGEDATPLPGPALFGNHVTLKTGTPAAICFIVKGEKEDTLRIDALNTGKVTPVTSATGLAAGSEFAIGNFRNAATPEFLIYKPGVNTLSVRPVQESGGKFVLAEGGKFDLGEPVRKAFALGAPGSQKLFVIFGDGLKATVYNFDGVKAPAVVQALSSTNQITGAAASSTGFVMFSQPADGKFSTRYETFTGTDSYTPGPYGSLPSLADNDNITIPDIHARIVQNLKEKSESDMQKYTNTIPGTRVTFVMVPIKGGEFVMGTPDNEANRKPDEGPQHKVKLEPFWMGAFEVTWNEYELFMYPDEEKRTRATVPTDASGDKLADAVTHPSKPYVEMSFGMGKDGYPAISMTQHAANKYCQWLSAKTGQFYRLPTEAEWEYACRAGTTTPYFFGDDPGKLPEYAWYEQNSDFKYQKVGKKKPNPWGLYDIHGNVVEWVLDQYAPDFYKQCANQAVTIDPWNKATKAYPHAVRGGSWDDEAKSLRSGARRGSDRSWKMQDPQLPKSVWYFSDAQWVGFRVVRPLKVPGPEALQKYWTSGVERD